jgi:hypothetical protein
VNQAIKYSGKNSTASAAVDVACLLLLKKCLDDKTEHAGACLRVQLAPIMGGLLSPSVMTEGGWRHPAILIPIRLSLSALKGSVTGSSAVAQKQLQGRGELDSDCGPSWDLL